MVVLYKGDDIIVQTKREKEMAKVILEDPELYDAWTTGEIRVNTGEKILIEEYINFLKIQAGAIAEQ